MSFRLVRVHESGSNVGCSAAILAAVEENKVGEMPALQRIFTEGRLP